MPDSVETDYLEPHPEGDRMATVAEIQAGRVYLVELRHVGACVRVRAVCPDLVRPGWWDCRNLETGFLITLPTLDAIWGREFESEAHE
jgi:hypothetical protein